MLKEYYQLIKPGMVYGNAITTAAGFLLASRGQINLWLLLATLAGLSLVIASGCVFNNYIDRDIDARMVRTRERLLVKGLIPVRNALLYGTILGVAGILVLSLYTNPLTLGVALFGFFAYVFMYTLWTKRYSVHSTLVGSLAGATPPVVGFCAVSGHIDQGAIMLFLILVLWQMPHFFAIGIYRLEDYTRASIPILPVKYGVHVTKIFMVFFILLFAVAVLIFPILGYVGHVYLGFMAILCAAWLGFAVGGFWTRDTKKWARIMFVLSLVIILSFSVLIAVDVMV